jgi:hypothetical protein
VRGEQRFKDVPECQETVPRRTGVRRHRVRSQRRSGRTGDLGRL